MSNMADKNIPDDAPNLAELIAAYKATTYRVATLDIDIRIGRATAALDLLLEQYGATEWAFISAWNPMSVEPPATDNDAAHRQLVEVVAAFPHFEGQGIGDDGLWPPERSLLILGVGLAEAVELGRRFRQHAVVCGVMSKEARLVVLEYI
jgi:hypothetical protein